MIQRVQSVYLFLITILMSFLLIRPYAVITLPESQSLSFHSYAILLSNGDNLTTVYKNTIPVVALVVIIGLLGFATIFLYNRRIVQIRMCVVNTVLLVSLLIIMLLYYISAKSSFALTHNALKIPAIFPLMGIVFNIMAYRLIHRDELLVNSYNRLR